MRGLLLFESQVFIRDYFQNLIWSMSDVEQECHLTGVIPLQWLDEQRIIRLAVCYRLDYQEQKKWCRPEALGGGGGGGAAGGPFPARKGAGETKQDSGELTEEFVKGIKHVFKRRLDRNL